MTKEAVSILERQLLASEPVKLPSVVVAALDTFASREREVAADAALRIALESGLSAYDAEYVALARVLREALDVARSLVDPSSTTST